MTLPKVLILGQPFDKKGGGITLSNLFADWEINKLAVVCSAQLLTDLNDKACKNYYQLGEKEIKWIFPLNLIERKLPSGILNLNNQTKDKDISSPAAYTPSFRRTFVDLLFYPFLKYSGVYHFRAKTILSHDFCQWLTEFKPDILYVQFSGLDGILFAQKLHKYLEVPMIVHMTDDWLSTAGDKGLFKTYWEKKIDKEFKKVIGQSKILMSICEAMSEEYKLRYNRDFIPFRNPINLKNWLPFSKNQWDIKTTFNILYTGRIGIANGKSIMLISNVISSLNGNGIKIKLNIYSPDFNTKDGDLLNSKRGVTVRNPIPHNEMPSLLPSYDLLFLPLDFDKEGIHFAQFSMPTKTSEYMISGTPILVFADKSTALAKYAIKYKWAFVVTDNDEKILRDAITELSNNLSLRKRLAEIAKNTAIRIDDADVVRKNFSSHFFKLNYNHIS
jgi:glycosyltransferase involved in cell wall biosynthesis